MAKPLIYLDHAAATPLDPRVLKAMQPYYSDIFYNPSATYEPAIMARKGLDRARSTIAHWLGARPAEIIFTAGGTEANNLAIHGVMRQFPEGNVLVSAIEHESVLAAAAGYDCRQVAVTADGRLDSAELERQLDDKTVLVSIGYANNEIGTVQPLREIAKIIAAKRRGRPNLPLYFHTDAAQAGNYLDLHVARLGVDLLTVNGGKIYGPKQSAALYVKAGVRLLPLIEGGGQERGLRSGTENVAAAAGLATALEIAQNSRHEESKRLQTLQEQFFQQVGAAAPTAVINGSRRWRLPNNVHLTFPGQDNERLLIQLEQAGILAAAGSACSASNEEPSHVLKAIGLSEAEARSSLRFSLGRATEKAMLEQTVKSLINLLSLTT
jgi:cysteine desulfurase